jgi:hypothetical protein
VSRARLSTVRTWPPRRVRCPGCSSVAAFTDHSHRHAKGQFVRRCGVCGALVAFGPLAVVEVDEAGIPAVRPCGFLAVLTQ